MAVLNDTTVNGNLSVSGNIYGTADNANKICVNGVYYEIVTTTNAASTGEAGKITFVLEA